VIHKWNARPEERRVHVHRRRWFAFRDYHRRCLFLTQRYRAGTLGDVKLVSYRLKVLWRMLTYLESGEHSLDDTVAVAAVVALLRPYLLRRRWPARVKKSVVPLKIAWETRGIKHVHLRKILESEEARSVFPSRWPDIVLSKRLPKTLASIVFNYSRVARSGRRIMGNCACHRLFPRRFRSHRDCVYTGDLSLIQSPELRRIFNYGTNFRLRVQDPNIMRAVRNALVEFADSQSSHCQVERSLYDPWIRAILRRVRTRAPQADSVHGVPLSRAARKYLKFLQRYLVIVPTDKTRNNVSRVSEPLSGPHYGGV
jgi:hypothetical protein